MPEYVAIMKGMKMNDLINSQVVANYTNYLSEVFTKVITHHAEKTVQQIHDVLRGETEASINGIQAKQLLARYKAVFINITVFEKLVQDETSVAQFLPKMIGWIDEVTDMSNSSDRLAGHACFELMRRFESHPVSEVPKDEHYMIISKFIAGDRCTQKQLDTISQIIQKVFAEYLDHVDSEIWRVTEELQEKHGMWIMIPSLRIDAQMIANGAMKHTDMMLGLIDIALADDPNFNLTSIEIRNFEDDFNFFLIIKGAYECRPDATAEEHDQFVDDGMRWLWAMKNDRTDDELEHWTTRSNEIESLFENGVPKEYFDEDGLPYEGLAAFRNIIEKLGVTDQYKNLMTEMLDTSGKFN